MTVTLRLFSVLARYLPPDACNNECKVGIREGETVADILRRFRIPASVPRILLINGASTTLTEPRPLADGDVIAIFPPMAGG